MMLKLITLAVFVSSLIQVTTQLSKYRLSLKRPTTTVGPPPDSIHPADVVTDDRDLSCTGSSDCPTGYSCRDSNGRILYKSEGGWGGGWSNLLSIQGTCGCAARPGEVCGSDSDCPKGYDCYRQMSGVCCPPSYCVTTEYAQYWRNYWANCRPPTCFFPAK